MRVPDSGGIVLVPQDTGTTAFQSIAGLIGYRTVTGFARLVLYHEGHNAPVPVDPRNGCINMITITTY